MPIRNIVGERFGRLVVVSLGPQLPNCGNANWKCRCDCGEFTFVRSNNLRTGHTSSCGCHDREQASKTMIRMSLKHGQGKLNKQSAAYRSWRGIRFRCENPKCKAFHRYGGRGISVCKRWYKFENFYADMGDRPPGKTLDRRNNDGNYNKRNCRWATPKEQARNRSSRKR